MLESIRVTEKLHWPKQELAKTSILNAEDSLVIHSKRSIPHLSPGVLKDIFTTGTSSYNVFLQSKEEKKHQSQKQSSCTYYKRYRKPIKSPSSSRKKDLRKMKVPVPEMSSGSWYCLERRPAVFVTSSVSSPVKFTYDISVAGNSIVLPPKPRNKVKRRHFSTLPKPKQQPQLSRSFEKDDVSGKKFCILTAIKPTNLEKEKFRFFKSDYTYNPQFEYANPALPSVLAKHSQASDRFLKQIVVHLTEDLLSRASMTVVNGCPTLTINVSTAREHWLEGMLRHEIGTHYFRGINNLQQPWNSWTGRKKHELKPNNPTEEGLASIHSVLFRKDPFLWRAALLYYTVYQASQMSFCELFRDIGKFVKDPNTRWDYCVRAKRGWTDTSQPGCFSKDQVYLDGILQILRYRETIDFHLLTALGKVSYEDVDRLKGLAVTENMRVPHFLQDHGRYMEHLEKIMEVNELTDRELRDLIY
ncbi:putative tyrosine carboxypeptidase MATCAP2 isoform X2 [Trichechus manatus latirostris]|uniref:Tyrosine carboxypeptidase MATCAP2 isoform X2 n=1 Tax=Trichechus manatus latirostris TaxID=127582 RepID=A0A2Y9E1D9_TRIMA|nr:putative tyrosine carboxypeptidase MATCAP2 isoform X2 [Trichechus manatus latirostris]